MGESRRAARSRLTVIVGAALLLMGALYLAVRVVSAQIAPPAAEQPPQQTPAPVPAPGPSAPQLSHRVYEDLREPEPRPIPVAQRQRIPVLMYHEITAGPNNLYVAPQELAGHLRWLKEQGYTAITLRQMADHYAVGAYVPPRPVVLTFDDGYSSYYENALPLLREYGWPGTLFVITGSVGQRGHMTWAQIKEAAAAGTEMGAHTVNHLSLELLSGERLLREIADSRQALREQTGQPIDFFCYPAGKYDDEVIQAVAESGFAGAVTTKFGYADPGQHPLLWERVRINKGLSPQGLGAVLANANSSK